MTVWLFPLPFTAVLTIFSFNSLGYHLVSLPLPVSGLALAQLPRVQLHPSGSGRHFTFSNQRSHWDEGSANQSGLERGSPATIPLRCVELSWNGCSRTQGKLAFVSGPYRLTDSLACTPSLVPPRLSPSRSNNVLPKPEVNNNPTFLLFLLLSSPLLHPQLQQVSSPTLPCFPSILAHHVQPPGFLRHPVRPRRLF